jgi:hypothetical protein
MTTIQTVVFGWTLALTPSLIVLAVLLYREGVFEGNRGAVSILPSFLPDKTDCAKRVGFCFRANNAASMVATVGFARANETRTIKNGAAVTDARYSLQLKDR